MKNLVLIVCVGALIFLLIGCSNKTTIHLEPSLSPAQAVDLFWRASNKGDEKLVERLVTTHPESYYKQCQLQRFEDSSNVEGSLIHPNNQELERELWESKDFSDVKFGRFLDPTSETYVVYLWANLIFVNKYTNIHMSIEKESLYENQSLVVIHYNNLSLQEEFNLYFFLTKESDHWKIFEIKEDSQLKTLINRNFGVSEIDCKE